MAAVSLFYDTNMATMTSCENILYMKSLLLVLFLHGYWKISAGGIYQGSKFKFEFGTTCATRCKFLRVYCQNFRRTAENFRSTAYNVGSIYFKRKSKKLNSAMFIISVLCWKTQPICCAVKVVWFLILIIFLFLTVQLWLNKNLHLRWT